MFILLLSAFSQAFDALKATADPDPCSSVICSRGKCYPQLQVSPNNVNEPFWGGNMAPQNPVSVWLPTLTHAIVHVSKVCKGVVLCPQTLIEEYVPSVFLSHTLLPWVVCTAIHLLESDCPSNPMWAVWSEHITQTSEHTLLIYEDGNKITSLTRFFTKTR